MINVARSWIRSLAFVTSWSGNRSVSLRSPLALLAGIVFAASALMCSPAAADNAVTNCGATISKKIKSRYNASSTINSGSFVNLPQAGLTVRVPAGQARCVVVRFSAILSCTTVQAVDHCYFRVTDNDNPNQFLPSGAVYTSDPLQGSYSFEFVGILGQGSHTLRMQYATSGNDLGIQNWTLVAEVSQAQ